MKLNLDDSEEWDGIASPDDKSHRVVEHQNRDTTGWTSPLMDPSGKFGRFQDQLDHLGERDRNRRKERFQTKV
jgi:hypothetical protein